MDLSTYLILFRQLVYEMKPSFSFSFSAYGETPTCMTVCVIMDKVKGLNQVICNGISLLSNSLSVCIS